MMTSEERRKLAVIKEYAKRVKRKEVKWEPNYDVAIAAALVFVIAAITLFLLFLHPHWLPQKAVEFLMPRAEARETETGLRRIQTEQTRDIPITENLERDFKQAIQEMALNEQQAGCKMVQVIAFTAPDKPNILTVLMKCADE